ncbi:MAG TPA: hypothetical protein DIW47_10315 [Bacteroidetes bacterium]|nr:hypothetical protein [Bacteroidota bacterium]
MTDWKGFKPNDAGCRYKRTLQARIEMKKLLILLFASHYLSVCGQSDTADVPDIQLERIHCAHGHICCQVFCYCCSDSLQFFRHLGPDYSLTVYPENDGLTYNQYIGETIAGFYIANGWREDTLNGGFNKEIYVNPYIESTFFDKHLTSRINAYRYLDGRLYTGPITDTLELSFTPKKIRGYLPNGQAYYTSEKLTVIFRANCQNGMVQGRGVLCGLIEGFGIYTNILLSECNFENGEIVGICKNWDLNSIDLEIKNGKIYSFEEEYDYFEFIKLLELTEVTYTKDSSDWIQRTTYVRNKETGKIKERTEKK